MSSTAKYVDANIKILIKYIRYTLYSMGANIIKVKDNIIIKLADAIEMSLYLPEPDFIMLTISTCEPDSIS